LNFGEVTVIFIGIRYMHQISSKSDNFHWDMAL